jgi:hypothetical protein
MKQFFKNYYIIFRVVSSELGKKREGIGFGKLKEKETNYERSCVFPHSILLGTSYSRVRITEE